MKHTADFLDSDPLGGRKGVLRIYILKIYSSVDSEFEKNYPIGIFSKRRIKIENQASFLV